MNKFHLTAVFIFSLSFGSAAQSLNLKSLQEVKELHANGHLKVVADYMKDHGFVLDFLNTDFKLGDRRIKSQMQFSALVKEDFIGFANEYKNKIIFETEEEEYKFIHVIKLELSDPYYKDKRPHGWVKNLSDQIFNFYERYYEKNGSDQMVNLIDTTKVWFLNSEGEFLTPNYREAFVFMNHGSKISAKIIQQVPKNPIDLSPAEYLKERKEKGFEGSVRLTQKGDVYYLPVQINEKEYSYILDSGAAETTITESMEKSLLANGFLRDIDYLPSAKFTLADGSTKTYRRILLHTIKVGHVALKNVACVITDDSSPSLAGKSILDKFYDWRIDNKEKVFLFKKL
jgi:predicted aspartyl protease